ncbi:hypothetical protein K8352_16175 [Flavobacteriaceae bacterium F89]|uniref:Uncharacterized protein n=1 Tax=Cerina litoralis TaxID=2874477 RepID=A0AAE3JQV7_9FLAO|nr:type IV toxin-antitoxin system AbiEi family antitoxin [Cerina litoralis]MCG2462299.1 hypothetical protein [Cerina litoralis]
MYRSNDLIYEAAENLGQLIDVPIEIDGIEQNYDALLTIKDVQFIVEAKSAVRTSNQAFILAQLEELKDKCNKPIILIAEYISKKATEELKKRSINYIDIAGNAFIKYNDLVIFIEGQKSTKKEKINQARAFQETGVKILFHLLSKPEHLQDTYRKIAEKAGVSLGSVSNVMSELEDLNYLLISKEKRVLRNKRELLQRWVVAYNEVLRPRIMRKRMRFMDPEYIRNWRNINVHTDQGTLVWAGEPGGALLTGNLRPEHFTVFTDLELAEVARTLHLVPSENGEMEVLQKFWKNDYNNKNVAPALLIYADLMNSGYGRNVEIANQILENDLQYI